MPVIPAMVSVIQPWRLITKNLTDHIFFFFYKYGFAALELPKPPNDILFSNDPDAAYLSNPVENNSSYAPGQKRGDPDQKDAYYHMNIIITRNLTYKDYGRQRTKLKLKALGKYKV